MTATAVRPAVRFARFILHKSVASRRYSYTFWNPKTLGGRNVTNKRNEVIGKSALKPGATQADVQKYEAAVAANGGNNKILFRSRANMGPGAEEVVYITDDPVIAAHVRSEIRSGRLKAREDVTVAPLQCPWCAFSLPSSTQRDQEEMYRHHLDDHADKLNEMVGTPVPVETPAEAVEAVA
jgi:hypothetical protein